MLFRMTFLTTFISIIKLYNQICQIFFLNLLNKLKIMIFNFMAKRKKSDLVPPTLHYCGHNAKVNRTKKIFVENLHAAYPYPLHYIVTESLIRLKLSGPIIFSLMIIYILEEQNVTEFISMNHIRKSPFVHRYDVTELDKFNRSPILWKELSFNSLWVICLLR